MRTLRPVAWVDAPHICRGEKGKMARENWPSVTTSSVP